MTTEPSRAPQPPWKRTLRVYLESLAVERGLSQNTVDAYRNDLTRLGEALARKQGDLLTADARALATSIATLCDAAVDDILFRAEPPVASLSAASVASLSLCVGAASTCEDARQCFGARVEGVAACYQ